MEKDVCKIILIALIETQKQERATINRNGNEDFI
jgi:hypothetical protein